MKSKMRLVKGIITVGNHFLQFDLYHYSQSILKQIPFLFEIELGLKDTPVKYLRGTKSIKIV